MMRIGEELEERIARSIELQKRVAKECSLLYGGKDFACWECGPGWDDVLEKLSYKLEALNILLSERWKVKIVAAQVKEKFGTLRFYFNSCINGCGELAREQIVLLHYANDVATEYVRQAEDECYCVCEECGTPIGTEESPRCCTTGWIAYICRNCAMRREEDRPLRIYETNGKFYKGEKEVPSPFAKTNKT